MKKPEYNQQDEITTHRTSKHSTFFFREGRIVGGITTSADGVGLYNGRQSVCFPIEIWNKIVERANESSRT